MAKPQPRAPLARGALLCILMVAGRAALAEEASGGGASSGAGLGGASSLSTASSVGTAGSFTAGSTNAPGEGGPLMATPSVLTGTGVGAAGPDVRVGNLGGQLARSLAGRPAERRSGPAWTVQPSLGLTEEFINGQAGSGTSRARNQSVTLLQPGLLLSGDTTRLHADASYTPQISLYPQDSSQNRVDQSFNGRLLATLVPQTLFLDLRGAASVQATTPGQAPNETTTLDRSDTTQTYSFSAAPYAVHRFGPWGTGEVGGMIAETIQNALAPAMSALGEAFNQNVLTTGVHAAFATGEAFARYSGTVLAQVTQFDGAGVLKRAYRDTASLDNGYALARTITALATVGWERIHYGGSSPVDINDAIWNVGIRLEPNALSTITVRYGHHDGLNALLVDAAYQPTARTRLYARYSTGLTTQAEQLQNALATSDLDALGNPVDHATGAPLIPVGNFFGTQNSLFKSTVASLTGVLLLDRDTISASLNSQEQTLLSASNALGLASGNTSGLYGALTWSHELRPNLQSTLYGQYGTQSSGLQSGSQPTLAASASLAYALSPTLSGQVQASYNQTTSLRGGFGSRSGLLAARSDSSAQTLILVSLIKSF